MATNEVTIVVGDIGTVYEITVKDSTGAIVDISSATVTKKIKFEKPDQTTMDKNASFVTDGTDGKLKYTFIIGDIDQSGTWKAQGYVELSSGNWTTTCSTFEVSQKCIT